VNLFFHYFVKMTVSLGFALPLSSPFEKDETPSKVGGNPVWISHPADSPICASCDSKMILLLEIFTNEDYPEQAENRMMYVFICPKGHSARALRCQAPELAFESYTTCAVCNFKADSACSSCSKIFYCGKKHQSLDWKLHKLECGAEESVEISRNPLAFPEFEICCEPEPDALVLSGLSLGENIPLVDSEDLIDDEDLDEPETESGVDKAFLKFQKRVEREPEQILRYCSCYLIIL
jgi:pre-rRNA-processing protein TSR4